MAAKKELEDSIDAGRRDKAVDDPSLDDIQDTRPARARKAEAEKPKVEEEPVLPGFSRGVRENAAQRMIKLAVPMCPNSKIEIELAADGKWYPKDKGPSEMNCQKAYDEIGLGWIKMCEELGHDPYFSTHTWYVPQDVLEPELDEDGEPTGVMFKTGEKYIKHEVRRPNVSQVAISLRINNGRGAVRAVQGKGFKRLSAIGYPEVCQYRNCQKPVTKAGSSRRYGLFCGRKHLSLCAANEMGVMLNQPSLDVNGPDYFEAVKRERQEKLDRAYTNARDYE